MCDVEAKLLGKNGATYVYGPQKGANETELKILENGMKNLTSVCKKNMALICPERTVQVRLVV